MSYMRRLDQAAQVSMCVFATSSSVWVCAGVLQDGSAIVFLTAGANTDVFV